MSKSCAVILGILGILLSLCFVYFTPGFKDGLMGYLGVIASIIFIVFSGGEETSYRH